MSVNTAKFTLDHYEHMVKTGAFEGPYKMRVELIHGEILDMSPIGIEHANMVNLLTEWSYAVADLKSMRVSVQNPIRVAASDSEPEPDVVWLRRKSYAQHPEAQDVLLLIEVADTSLQYDRGQKLAVYAEAGIADYWIVNLLESQIEVYRNPAGNSYNTVSLHTLGEKGPNPLADPSVTLTPGELFPV